MPVHNSEIAEILTKVADLLDIRGENPFRIRAYRNAARTVGSQGQSVASMLEEGKDLSELSGIGKDLAGKIAEFVETGKLSLLEDLERETPAELTELLEIPGLGPKKSAVLYRKLGIKTLADLAAAAKAGKIRGLEGFGKKSEEKIRNQLARRQGTPKRTKLAVAEEIVEPLLAFLQDIEGVKEVVAAGSYRRRKETVGDLDILAVCEKGSPAMERFIGYEDVREIVSRGQTRSTVLLRAGFQVDLRVVPQVSYGAALHYFTGSKEHNIAIRQMGVKKGLKINEYGVFRGEERISRRAEEDIFEAVGLPYIVPELRENRGEIEAAGKGELPELVRSEDIRGDLHAHTDETDGRSTLEQMVAAARERGYEYLAVTDHSQSVTVARGMDQKRLEKQIAAIDECNGKLEGFRLLKAIELDILEDGSLDLPDEVLEKLDLTVCSIHSRFGLSAQKQTERLIRAMDNRHFKILGHPSGRLINEREPYELDWERLMEAARERGCFFEVNAHPDRLDLTDIHCKMAKDLGVKVSIATDAHLTTHLDFMRYGVDQARRGWLTREDVLNTRSVRELLSQLKR